MTRRMQDQETAQELEMSEVCDECDGSGKLRNNKWKKGTYTFGFIECDECGGTGVVTHNNKLYGAH